MVVSTIVQGPKRIEAPTEVCRECWRVVIAQGGVIPAVSVLLVK